LTRVDPILARRLYRLSLASASAAAGLSALAVVGWVFGVPRLTNLFPVSATMKMNTAVSLLLCSTAMILRLAHRRRRTMGRLADAAAAAALLIGLLTMAEYVSGRSFGIDQLLVHDPAIPPHGHMGRMSIATALSVMLVSGGVLLLDRMTRLSQSFVISGAAIALLGLVGYLYSVKAIHSVTAFSSMAITTAFALCLISVAHLTARPRRCLHHLLVSSNTAGRLARRLLPATVIVPLVVGWLRLKGQQAGWYETEFGLALYAVCNIVILGGIVWWNTLLLNRAQTDHRRLEADRNAVLIREQVARARAEKALLARDQLLAVVSHELRTPLTPALLTATALAHRANLPVDVQDDLQLIHEQIEIEARLIDDLLDLTSLRQGKLTLNQQPVDLHDIARDVAAWMKKDAAEHHIQLTLELDSTTPVVMGDAKRLRQIVANLLGNSIKFTPPGGQVRLRTYDSADNRLALEAVDTGTGFEPEMLARLFEAFEQADPSTTRRYGGLGIGLAISKYLVELHSGTLAAMSLGVNRGASFIAHFPRYVAPTTVPATHKPSVLLVDDNAQILMVMERLLKLHGYEISTAGSAKEALASARARSFDVLVSDIGLPDLSGWELMRQLRETVTIRGIAVSGFVDEADRAKSLESGFSLHLSKPLDVPKLIGAIESVTAGKA